MMRSKSPPARVPAVTDSTQPPHGDPTQSITEAASATREKDAARESWSSAGLKQWGDFHLLQRLGQGGFGEVYRAWDPVLEREIAVKLLLPSGLDAEQELSSVISEARALARVRHPNIVPVYGVERRDGRVGFWSDYIRGRTLKTLVETEGPLDALRVAALGASLCDALAAVHAAGLLHRDVKASNAMVDENGRVLLMDFGLSQELHGAATPAGTPKYMAPELWKGGKASVQSDIYAMGILLHFLATGRYLIVATTSPEGTSSVARSSPLLGILQKATAEEPENRYPSATRFAEALRALQPANSTTAMQQRPRSRWLIVSAAVLVVLLALAAAIPRLRTEVHSVIGSASPAASADYLAAEEALVRYDQPGNVERAVSLYQKTIDRTPDSALAYAGLARAYRRLYGKTSDEKWMEQANTAANKALDLNPNLAEVQMTAGQLHVAQGKGDLGMQELQKALELDPRSGPVHGVLAAAYERQGRTDQAKTELQKAIDLAPDDWRWPADLGALYLSDGEYKLAEESLKLALDKTPENAEVFYNLGYLDYFEKRLAQARSAFERAVQIAPSNDAILALGSVLQAQGDYPSASKTYQRAVDLDPSSWKAWSGLADAQEWIAADPHLVAASYAKATQFARLAQKNTPEDPDLLAELGLFYATSLQTGKSVPLLRKAALLAPKDPHVLYHIASAYERLGQRPMAIQMVDRAFNVAAV